MTNFNYDLFKVSKTRNFNCDLFEDSKMTNFNYDLFKVNKMTNFNYDLFKVSKITNFKLRVMEQPVKLSQGTRKAKTNNYFVYRYTFIFFF